MSLFTRYAGIASPAQVVMDRLFSETYGKAPSPPPRTTRGGTRIRNLERKEENKRGTLIAMSKGGETRKEISRISGISRTTIQHRILDCIKEGLVVETPTGDNQHIRLLLTEKGQEYVRQIDDNV